MPEAASNEALIACTLREEELSDRLDWIAELNRKALTTARQEGRRLVLTYRAGHAGDVREMVRLERQCCAFLGFEMDERDDAVVLMIEAPDAATETLDAVFAPYLPGSREDIGCGCQTTCQTGGDYDRR